MRSRKQEDKEEHCSLGLLIMCVLRQKQLPLFGSIACLPSKLPLPHRPSPDLRYALLDAGTMFPISYALVLSGSPKEISVTYSSPFHGETKQTQAKTAFYEIVLCTVMCFIQDDFNLSPTLTYEAATAVFMLISLQLPSLCDLRGMQRVEDKKSLLQKRLEYS